MSDRLTGQIAAIEYILANKLVDTETALHLVGAKASLQFLLKHERGIRDYIEEIRRAKDHPQIKSALTYFPDAEIVSVRKTT